MNRIKERKNGHPHRGIATSGRKLTERKVYEFIKSIFPLSTDFRFDDEDTERGTREGIGVEFRIGDKRYTLRHNVCTSVYKGRDSYFISGVDTHKAYGDSYMGFQTMDGRFLLFENRNTEIREYDGKKKYVLPIDALMYSK